MDRTYNWGTGPAEVEEAEDPGQPDHPMQKEIVDVKPLHGKVESQEPVGESSACGRTELPGSGSSRHDHQCAVE